MGPVRQLVTVSRIQENTAISIKLKTTIERIGDNGVIIQCGGKIEEIAGIDSVVLAWNRSPVNQLADDLLADGEFQEIYRIGDAVLPRDAYEAIYEGASIGRAI